MNNRFTLVLAAICCWRRETPTRTSASPSPASMASSIPPTPSSAAPTSTSEPSATPVPAETRVRFDAGEAEVIVCTADNPTSRDFVSILPLSLEFEDFAGNEKISYLPRELITEGSPVANPPTATSASPPSAHLPEPHQASTAALCHNG
jgi:hypothetical protein